MLSLVIFFSERMLGMFELRLADEVKGLLRLLLFLLLEEFDISL